MSINAISSKSNFNNAFSKEEAGIYAKMGEPMYLKEMDPDEDGKVTFDEFREYCKANGLSSGDIEKLLELRAMYKMMEAQKEKEEEQEQKDNIYSKKKDETSEENKDTAADFEEYLEYCKQNARVEDCNKIQDKYSPKEPKKEDITVEMQA